MTLWLNLQTQLNFIVSNSLVNIIVFLHIEKNVEKQKEITRKCILLHICEMKIQFQTTESFWLFVKLLKDTIKFMKIKTPFVIRHTVREK